MGRTPIHKITLATRRWAVNRATVRRRGRGEERMETTIRPIAARDEPEWRVLWTGYLEFYETSVPEEVYRTTFARLLSEDPHEFHGRSPSGTGG